MFRPTGGGDQGETAAREEIRSLTFQKGILAKFSFPFEDNPLLTFEGQNHKPETRRKRRTRNLRERRNSKGISGQIEDSCYRRRCQTSNTILKNSSLPQIFLILRFLRVSRFMVLLLYFGCGS